MKVLLVNNPNNNCWSILKHLRRDNIDAWLVLDESKELAHFNIDSDSNNLSESYMQYVIKVDYFDMKSLFRIAYFNKQKKNEIREFFQSFDVLIGTRNAPAIMEILNLKLDLFLSSGGDLRTLPFIPLLNSSSLKKSFIKYMISRLQRRGIKNSSYICTGGYRLNLLKKINVKGKLINNLIFPMIDDLQNYELETDADHIKEITKLKQRGFLIAISQCRHFFTTDAEGGKGKGTREMLIGFASFVMKAKAPIKLLLFEYGPDLEKSKSLIKFLKVEDHIIWFPLQPRKSILELVYISDIVIENLNWVDRPCSSSALEAVCLNKPLIKNINESQVKKLGFTMYPFINAHNEKTLCDALVNFIENLDALKEQSAEGSTWYLEHSIKRFVSLIREISDNK